MKSATLRRRHNQRGGSSLSDPADIARAYAALDAIWNEVKERIPDACHDSEKQRIAHLVAELAPMALDEEDLKRNVLLHLRQSAAA